MNYVGRTTLFLGYGCIIHATVDEAGIICTICVLITSILLSNKIYTRQTDRTGNSRVKPNGRIGNPGINQEVLVHKIQGLL